MVTLGMGSPLSSWITRPLIRLKLSGLNEPVLEAPSVLAVNVTKQVAIRIKETLKNARAITYFFVPMMTNSHWNTP
jgi:hypothetical protein